MINEKRLLDTFIGYAMIDSETKNEKACIFTKYLSFHLVKSPAIFSVF